MSKDKPSLIPAVAYLRKSTKGKKLDRHGRKQERQEKSLEQQRQEITKLAAGRFQILKWYEDEGVSGWKRGAKRPDFTRMLQEVKDLGAEAIICDALDRFSRAAVADVQEDANALHKAGVRWIVTANGREYDLGARYDIGAILNFVVEVWSANKYSRDLSRRISLARRNKAREGKRSGGAAAYGLEDDGNGGLKPGNPEQVKIVNQIFEQFANCHRSLYSIINDLNQRHVPSPSGGKWFVPGIARLLRRRCYRGDFTYNVSQKQGKYHTLDEKGEVVEIEQFNGKGKVEEKNGIYEPIVNPALFDAAQRRLELLTKDRSRRKRAGYALTGILVCHHCGSKMYGVKMRGNTVYRCGHNMLHGGGCLQAQVREDLILPWFLGKLSREMEDLKTLLAAPPDNSRSRASCPDGQRKHLEKGRERLLKRIKNTEDLAMDSDDPRNRQSYDSQVSELRDQLDEIDKKLGAISGDEDSLWKERLQALNDELEWLHEFLDHSAVFMPTDQSFQDPQDPKRRVTVTVPCDPRLVNERLHRLGAWVRLRWETKKLVSAAGKPYTRHVLAEGRFQLGHQSGKLPRYVLEPLQCRCLTSPLIPTWPTCKRPSISTWPRPSFRACTAGTKRSTSD